MPTAALVHCPKCRAAHAGRCPRARKPWANQPSRHLRGLGYAHDVMRKRVLMEEPACRICGSTGEPTLDHIVPRAEGGDGSRENSQRLCRRCQEAKGSREGAAARWRRVCR